MLLSYQKFILSWLEQATNAHLNVQYLAVPICLGVRIYIYQMLQQSPQQ